jgi:nucleoid-associated protein YgaU
MALAIHPHHLEPAPQPRPTRPDLHVVTDGRPRVSAATYRRRRLVVGVVAAALVTLTGFALQTVGDRGGVPASAAAIAPELAPGSSYVVQPGDSLWTIAERVSGAGDVSRYVERLISLNGGTAIQVGQQLRLPG